MSEVELLCPRCRSMRELLRAAGADAMLVGDGQLPDHLPNCPARKLLDLNGIKVETYLDVTEPAK